MATAINHYGTNVFFNKEVVKTVETNSENIKNNNKDSFKVSKLKGKLEEFENKNREFLSTCTDDKDDGKVGFKQGSKAFWSGVANHYISIYKEGKAALKENPVKYYALGIIAVVSAGLAIVSLGAPFVVGILSGIGIITGAKGLYNSVKEGAKNIKNAKNSETDAEKKQALYGLGDNSAEFAGSAVALYTGVKGIKFAHSKMSNFNNYLNENANVTNNVSENLGLFGEKITKGDISEDEIDIIMTYIENRDGFFKIEPGDFKRFVENIKQKL